MVYELKCNKSLEDHQLARVPSSFLWMTKQKIAQDAAIMVHMSFRAYLIRRSQAFRALRDLAVAKAKLKEIRVLFNNCRHRVTDDAEERQRIFEKIIVLLIHVDDIEGADPWCKNYNIHPKRDCKRQMRLTGFVAGSKSSGQKVYGMECDW